MFLLRFKLFHLLIYIAFTIEKDRDFFQKETTSPGSDLYHFY